MSQFQYTARAVDNGEMLTSTCYADNEGQVRSGLKRMGYTVDSLEPQIKKDLFGQRKRVKLIDLVNMCRRFSVMYAAGLPLLECLNSLAEENESKSLSDALLIAFVNIQTIDLNLIKNNLGSKKTYYIAEAGIADAINEIRTNGPLADTQWEKNFPTGSSDTYSVAVSQRGLFITSTGHAAASNFSRTLEVKVAFFHGHGSMPYVVAVDQFKEITQ